ncbi:G-protein coupled receptor 1-like [Impatiens glandulifera]|uniref:G-protein coupled receptor 1-like n=1 Tax=Impatiens glandulifera TaxID=253017 RepID=UPI001FB17E65|nr:G-protein coupled receptor 1-like [Impatiens glandulifera]
MEPMFQLYVWGTSLVTSTVTRSIGDHHEHLRGLGAWCLTQLGTRGKAVHLITFYIPFWGAILFNGITYFQVIRMLNNVARIAAGMSSRLYQPDWRPDMKFFQGCLKA